MSESPRPARMPEMATAHVFIATSLDGYIARADGSVDWLMRYDSDEEDYGYGAFMADIDGIVMGRGSYETVRAFDPWPYDRPVTVASQTLGSHAVPEHLSGRVDISSASPETLLTLLAAAGQARGRSMAAGSCNPSCAPGWCGT
ncbi:MAG: dihydrofolate reductase family protein [Geminicoccaceae bacterium]